MVAVAVAVVRAPVVNFLVQEMMVASRRTQRLGHQVAQMEVTPVDRAEPAPVAHI